MYHCTQIIQSYFISTKSTTKFAVQDLLYFVLVIGNPGAQISQPDISTVFTTQSHDDVPDIHSRLQKEPMFAKLLVSITNLSVAAAQHDVIDSLQYYSHYYCQK